ncbi:MAG: YtxH domain-containing protein [Candidatus Staskawiczbacteria bacterium]|nr:YtxH domain-containing protein [Candidatus Staskawiczbacteria bacterium]
MAKGNTLKFLEGAVAGIALGVAASMFLSSKKGRELKNDIADVAADFYKYISPKVKKIEKMGEKEYKEFMKNAAERYSKTKKISEDMAKDLVKDAQQSWKHFSKHLGK